MLKNLNFVKLGTILIESKEEVTTPDPKKRIRVKLNVRGVEKRPEINDVEGATKYYRRKGGQFIYGKQNLFKGAFGIVPFELDGFESSSDLPAFNVDKSCNPEWIYYFLRHDRFYERLTNLATGTGSRRVQPKKLYDLEIPLPQRSVQDELVSRFKAIENKKRSLDAIYKENKERIQNLRQTILKEAVSGKLVSQDPNEEPASELLGKISSEKESLIREGKTKRESLKPISNEEIPYQIPRGWA
jgi:type I restriction enzyme S subunit